MAPDLDSLKVDYSTPGSEGYAIPDIVYNDPQNRRLKVISIGTGMSSIMSAYQLQKQLKNIEHVIYEKNHDIGGTWLENRYPGCACDIPSHAYTFNFALNPDWPRYFSESRDIWAYFNKVVEVFDLRKYMVFNTEVTGVYWQEDDSKWLVKLRCGNRVFEDTCDLLLYAKGILNTFQMPQIPGLEKFKGLVVHTARWPEDYQKEEWAKDRVAVIGSGASSVQTVPTMQPHVKHMDIFVRTGVWFAPIVDNYGQNYEYSEEQRSEFRKHPEKLLVHARAMDSQINATWGGYYLGSENQKMRDFCYSRMKELIKDERLLQGFTPTFNIGCRRITPGDPYMLAIQKENVDVHFTAINKIVEDGVIGDDGVERKVDTIVCATGFDASFRPPFPVVGRGDIDLRDRWAEKPEAYLGLAIPDYPNFIMFMGPTWPVANGSVSGPLSCVGQYAVQVLQKMQRENIKTWMPRRDITDQFNQHAQEWVKHTVWKYDCRSWYQNNRTGRLNAIWPGSVLHYEKLIESPRWEDMHIEYNYSNPWAMLGMGYVPELKDPENSDLSPHLTFSNIDREWLKAMGSPVPDVES